MKHRDAYIMIEKLQEVIDIIKEYLPKEEKKEYKCLNCGKLFERKGHNQKFCSEYCKNQFGRKRKRGEV